MFTKRPSRVKSAGAGLAAGVVLGLAAGLFLRSEKGQELQKDVQQKAKLLQKQILARAEYIDELTEEGYEELVDQVLEAYAKSRRAVQAELPELRKELRKQWKHVRAFVEKRV